MIKIRYSLFPDNFEQICNEMYEKGYKLIDFVIRSANKYGSPLFYGVFEKQEKE